MRASNAAGDGPWSDSVTGTTTDKIYTISHQAAKAGAWVYLTVTDPDAGVRYAWEEVPGPSGEYISEMDNPIQNYPMGPGHGLTAIFHSPEVTKETMLTFRLIECSNDPRWAYGVTEYNCRLEGYTDREGIPASGAMVVDTVEYTALPYIPQPFAGEGSIPTALVPKGSSSSFVLRDYFTDNHFVNFSVESVADPDVAGVTIEPGSVGGFSRLLAVVQGRTEGETTAKVKMSLVRQPEKSVTQEFKILVVPERARIVPYVDPKERLEYVELNNLVPEDVFDNSYRERRQGRYIPYRWTREQLSGPTMKLSSSDYFGATFQVPNIPHGTKMEFRVTATNPAEMTRSYDLLVVVSNPDNERPIGQPTANAGHDRTLQTSQWMELDGTGSASPTGRWWDLDFLWEIESAPERVLRYYRDRGDELPRSPRGYYAYFDMPQLWVGESLVFKLTVSIWSQTDSDTVVIYPATPRRRAQADAGPDQAAAPGGTVVLQGRDGSDPNGEGGEFIRRWSQLSGPPVSISDDAAMSPSFIAPPEAGEGLTLEFELTVTDQEGESDSDTVIVTVNRPTANAGPDQAAPPDATVTLQGAGSVNPYGKWWHLEYLWTQLSGLEVTISDQTEPEPTFTMPSQAADGTTLEFQLTVTDQEGASDSDTVTLTVDSSSALRPTACAGPDLTGAPGDSMTLQGTCSENPYGRWWKLVHSWTQLSGPTVTLDEPTHGNPAFTLPADAAGGTTLEFQLTVTDKEGESDSDTMIVTVAVAEPEPSPEPENTPPTAAIDVAQVTAAVAGETVALQGGGDAETAAESLTFAWSQVAGTPQVSITSAESATASFTTPDVTGETELTFRLTVTDEGGLSASAETTIAISPPPEPENTPPTAAIDATQVTAAESGETVALQGVGNDAETAAESLTFAWSQVAGTPTVSIANASTATASFTAPDVTEDTELTFRLTVTDEGGLSASAETTIAISPPPEPENTPPTFDEGDSAIRSLAENSAAGTNVGAPLAATDLDGNTLTYSRSGDDAGSFDLNAATGQLTTVAGVSYDYESKSIYAVTVEVSDSNGGIASISVTVNLTDANDPPVFDQDGGAFTIMENAGAGEDVGTPLTATDQDSDTLTYFISGTDAGSFDIDAATGQLQTKSGVTYDYEPSPHTRWRWRSATATVAPPLLP